MRRGALALACVLAASSVSAGYRGRPLVDALADLRSRGLKLIFSSAIVGPELVVAEEPKASEPRKILDEILPAVGLRAEDTAAGAILIVRAPPRHEVRTPPPRFFESIVVTPGHHEIVPQDVSVTRSIDSRDVTLAPTLGSDAARSVALLPGVAASDASAAFYPRGAASSDVSLILDGLELYDPFHLSGFQRPFSLIDGRVVDSVDFTGGGFTADRGDRNGGFVEMSTASPLERATTEVEIGTLNSRIAYSAPAPSGPIVVSGRYWYPQATSDTVAFGSDGLKPSLGDLYVRAGLAATPTTLASAHALLAFDRAHLRASEAGDPEWADAASRSGTVWVRLLRAWSETISTDTVVSAGTLTRSRTGATDPDGEAIALDDQRRVRFAGVRTDASWTIGGPGVVRGGIEGRFLDADFTYANGTPGAVRPSETERSGESLAAYAAYRRAITWAVTMEGGLRWDRQTYTGARQWSPRLNLVGRATARDEFRLALGSYAQSLRIHELRIEDGQTDYPRPELSKQIDVAYVHRFASPLSFRLDAYLNRLSHVTPRYENLHKPVELFPELEPDRALIAPESARLEGVEVSMNGSPSKALQWSASYTWSKAMDVIDGASVPRSWDQTHAGKFLVSYRWERGWFLAANGVVHTGWPTTPVHGVLVTSPDGETTIEPVLGPRNSARLPVYGRLDLRAGRTVATGKGSLRFELSVLNATDRDNACCLDEASFVLAPDGEVETRTAYDNWLGITPTLQVVWSF
jgi:hypothetical protein